MKYQPRVKKPSVKAAPGTGSSVHPEDVPRAATGSKGDAWVVSLPADDLAPGSAVLAFDTGRDSTTIVIGEAHGPAPRVHPGHDLGIVVPAGSGELRYGSAQGTLAAERYVGPCTLVVPAGTWHAVLPDPVSGPLTAFFTRPGEVIDPFSGGGPRAEPGLVHLDTLPVAPWPMTPARVLSVPGANRPGAPAAGAVEASTPGPTRPARVVPYEAPGDTYSLPLDTGSDTLFVMTSHGRSWDRGPVDVAGHRPARGAADIVLDVGAGWVVNGGPQDSVVRTAWTAPCVLVMPSGNFHRVVRTDDEVGSAILVYAHRGQVTASWDGIVAEMVMGEVAR